MSIKQDPKFRDMSRRCTKHSYLSNRLRDNDYNGYCSAGILIITDTYHLIREVRDGVDGLSIPGGKRDYIEEDPKTCAMREYREEGGSIDISRDDLYKVLWYAPGKYVLYIIDRRDSIYDDIDGLCSKMSTLSLSEYPLVPKDTHSFSRSMIESLISLSK